MKILIKTAFKNIIAGGTRTWLNVAVLSFTFVVIIMFNAMVDGWVEESKRDTIEWEIGNGQLWNRLYDKYDVFTLQDAHGVVPAEFKKDIETKTLTPILITQGVVYPQGRMQNILIKGIDPDQQILKIPSALLKPDGSEIKALIGRRMAEAAKLKTDDRVMLRWRDKNGAFDAREIRIAGVFNCNVPAVDNAQVWIDLNQLRQLTAMTNEATLFVKSDENTISRDSPDWKLKDLKFLFTDIDLMMMSSRVETAVIFILLLSIALLAVFDSQMLSIFRRQKEIGTYVALGMTPKRVSFLFTLEGTCYSILAVLAGGIWGTPLMILFAKHGFKMPGVTDDIGVASGNILYPAYHVAPICLFIFLIIVSSALISYLPARKIARQNIVNALKGKIA